MPRNAFFNWLIPAVVTFSSPSSFANGFSITDTVGTLQRGTQHVQESLSTNNGLLQIGKQEFFSADNKEYARYSGTVSTGGQTLTAAVEAAGPHGASVSVSLDFAFAVSGPQNIPVPVIMFTPDPFLSLHAPTDPFNQNRAYAAAATEVTHVLTTTFLNFSEKKLGSFFGGGSDTFVPSLHFDMIANKDVGTEHLTLVIGVVGVRVDPGQAQIIFNATGFLDPYFIADPNFADAALYHIQLSPGVNNGSPVPAPTSWLCLLSGLVGLGTRPKGASVQITD